MSGPTPTPVPPSPWGPGPTRVRLRIKGHRLANAPPPPNTHTGAEECATQLSGSRHTRQQADTAYHPTAHRPTSRRTVYHGQLVQKLPQVRQRRVKEKAACAGRRSSTAPPSTAKPPPKGHVPACEGAEASAQPGPWGVLKHSSTRRLLLLLLLLLLCVESGARKALLHTRARFRAAPVSRA